MESKCFKGTHLVVFLLACTCATASLSSAVCATDLLPFLQSDNSVRIALAVPDGQVVTCQQAQVVSIHARNNPSFMTICDSSDPTSKIVVLCRVPLSLRPNLSVTVTGTMATLPGTSERCIVNPVIGGYYDDNGNLISLPPLFGFLPADDGAAPLEQPNGPIAPSDPSLPDDGTGIAGPVTANLSDEVTLFGSAAGLLSAAPPILSLAQLSCESVIGTGDGFIVVGDDNTSPPIKVYATVAGQPGDVLISLTGIVHTENGRLVLYAGAGPSPYYDLQGPRGDVMLAGPDAVAGAKGTLPTPTQSSTMASALSASPPQIDGGAVDLDGKVVTAVFFQPGTQTISSFYIQEPTVGGNGIKVIPEQSCWVEVGDIVEVIGTVVASSVTIAECYIDASWIDWTGYQLIARPAGMPQRYTAGGGFGLQQALYTNSTVTPAVQGTGLSTVGTLVRVWGAVTWRSQDGTVCFVDDGTALKSSYSSQQMTGIRVIWPQECPSAYQVGDYAAEITGELGAELSEDNPALPVPVVRVPCSGQGNTVITPVTTTELDYFSALVSYCGS